jgi:hypothetical protein
MPGGFQQQVNTVPGVAVAGDFSDQNPRQTLDAGPGGLVAGPSGVQVALWAWPSFEGMDPDNAPTIVNNFGPGAPAGVICREQQGLNAIYLSDASQLIPTGFPVTVFVTVGTWVVNNGTTAARYGQKCYANLSNGQSSFAATGAAGSASISASIAAASASITGYVVGNVLTVISLASGSVAVGSLLYGTVGGSGVQAGTFVAYQLTGTGGQVGTYALTQGEQQVSGTAGGSLSVSYGVLSVGTLTSGQIYLNGSLTAAGVSPGTLITQAVSGSGAGSTWNVNNTQTVSAGTTITLGQTAETNYYALSQGQPGELIKISKAFASNT